MAAFSVVMASRIMAQRQAPSRLHQEPQTKITANNRTLNICYNPTENTDILVVFIHGLAGQLSQFSSHLHKTRNSHPLSTLALDYYGHGIESGVLSALDSDYTIDAIVADLVHVISSMQKYKIIFLVCHSYGCTVGVKVYQKLEEANSAQKVIIFQGIILRPMKYLIHEPAKYRSKVLFFSALNRKQQQMISRSKVDWQRCPP